MIAGGGGHSGSCNGSSIRLGADVVRLPEPGGVGEGVAQSTMTASDGFEERNIPPSKYVLVAVSKASTWRVVGLKHFTLECDTTFMAGAASGWRLTCRQHENAHSLYSTLWDGRAGKCRDNALSWEDLNWSSGTRKTELGKALRPIIRPLILPSRREVFR